MSSLSDAAQPRLGSQPPSSFPDFAFLEGRKAPMQMLPVPSMPSALRPPLPQASGRAAPLKFDPQALNAQTSSGPQQAPLVPQAAARSHHAHAGVAPRAPPAPPLPPAFAPPAHASHPASARGEPASGQVGRVTVPAGHPARTSTSGGAGLSGLSPGTAASSSANALGRPTGTKAKRQVTIVGTDAESQETMRRFLAVSLRHHGGTMTNSRRKPNAGKLAAHHDDLSNGHKPVTVLEYAGHEQTCVGFSLIAGLREASNCAAMLLHFQMEDSDAESNCPFCGRCVHGRAPKDWRAMVPMGHPPPPSPRNEALRRYDHLRKVHAVVTCDRVGGSTHPSTPLHTPPSLMHPDPHS